MLMLGDGKQKEWANSHVKPGNIIDLEDPVLEFGVDLTH